LKCAGWIEVTSQRKIAAIQAIAMDDRGEPNTRAIARRWLLEHFERLYPEYPEYPDVAPPRANPANPRTQPSQEYEKFRFMDLSNWRLLASGNPTVIVMLDGKAYRVTLYKLDSVWRWVRHDPDGGKRFSNIKFVARREAQEDAWNGILYSMKR
jgi:hypothetical protein